MSDTQKQPVTIASLRQRLDQIESAPMWQQPALARQAVSEAVTLVEQQEKRLESIEDRLAGLENINGVL